VCVCDIFCILRGRAILPPPPPLIKQQWPEMSPPSQRSILFIGSKGSKFSQVCVRVAPKGDRRPEDVNTCFHRQHNPLPPLCCVKPSVSTRCSQCLHAASPLPPSLTPTHFTTTPQGWNDFWCFGASSPSSPFPWPHECKKAHSLPFPPAVLFLIHLFRAYVSPPLLRLFLGVGVLMTRRMNLQTYHETIPSPFPNLVSSPPSPSRLFDSFTIWVSLSSVTTPKSVPYYHSRIYTNPFFCYRCPSIRVLL